MVLFYTEQSFYTHSSIFRICCNIWCHLLSIYEITKLSKTKSTNKELSFETRQWCTNKMLNSIQANSESVATSPSIQTPVIGFHFVCHLYNKHKRRFSQKKHLIYLNKDKTPKSVYFARTSTGSFFHIKHLPFVSRAKYLCLSAS